MQFWMECVCSCCVRRKEQQFDISRIFLKGPVVKMLAIFVCLFASDDLPFDLQLTEEYISINESVSAERGVTEYSSKQLDWQYHTRRKTGMAGYIDIKANI